VRDIVIRWSVDWVLLFYNVSEDGGAASDPRAPADLWIYKGAWISVSVLHIEPTITIRRRLDNLPLEVLRRGLTAASGVAE